MDGFIMDEKKCPFCGSKLYKSAISDRYVCEKTECPGVFELDSPLLLLPPTYREEKMFKVKPYGKISFFVNRDKLKFVIRAGSKDYGAYDISQLIEFSVSDISYLNTRKDIIRRMMKMVVQIVIFIVLCIFVESYIIWYKPIFYY